MEEPSCKYFPSWSRVLSHTRLSGEKERVNERVEGAGQAEGQQEGLPPPQDQTLLADVIGPVGGVIGLAVEVHFIHN